MTVTEILQDAYRRLNFSTSPAAEVTTRLLAFANDAHRELVSMPGMDQLRDDQIRTIVTSGYARWGLGPGISRIQAIMDTSRQLLLREVTMAEIRTRNPGQTLTGIPDVFARVGDVGTQVPLDTTAATLIYAKCAVTLGNTTQTLTVHGLDATGAIITGTHVMNGTTAVNISGGTYVDLTKAYLDAVCNAAVTIYAGDPAAGGINIATIPAGQLFVRYHGIQLDPVPSASITYLIHYTREIFDLVVGNDEPLLPRDFHRLIGLGIRKREYEKMSDSRYTAVDAEYEEGKRALRSWVQSDGTNTMSLRSSATAMRPSQLGAYYPAGS